MRLVLALIGFAGLSFAQSTLVADGRLIGAGNSVGLSVEVSEGSRMISLARMQVNSDSSFKVQLPLDRQTREFRVLNQRGELIQVIYQWPQRGVPIELRLAEAPDRDAAIAAAACSTGGVATTDTSESASAYISREAVKLARPQPLPPIFAADRGLLQSGCLQSGARRTVTP